ncbi:MAG: right-handed parallel beta-helix repeat-containing protein [Acidobacteria bacterium]|nr:right-handed parallel beta-helix repeat-containing protein [Acidobacteriota bacterium]
MRSTLVPAKLAFITALCASGCWTDSLISPLRAGDEERSIIVTVGPADTDIIGTDNVAIQKAIDQVARAGGGTVLVKAGAYTLSNSVRLASHVALQGEGAGKTILRKGPGVRSRLVLDADYGEFQATVEEASGFAPGMGVTVVDKSHRSGWYPSVRTIVRIEGNTLFFDRYLHLDYLVENGGEVFNAFPLVAGYEVEDVTVRDLTADGNRAATEILDGCQAGAIYFYHSRNFRIRNCVARDFAGDGISTQFVEYLLIENCEAFGNAYLGIHLGTGAKYGNVRHNRTHDNGQVGLFLCWRVQQGRFEQNQCWGNGEYGISIGHKDTDNLFVKNSASGNGKAGIYFRDEAEINAGHRNTFIENTIEDNGRPDAPGYGVQIEGATRHITLESNTIRDTRSAERATQQVGIYIGPRADYVTASKNIFSANLRHAVRDESTGGNNELEHPTLH